MVRSYSATLSASYYRRDIRSPMLGRGLAWQLPIVVINQKTEITWITLPLRIKPKGVGIITSTCLALAVWHPDIYPLLNTVSHIIAVSIIIPSIRFVLVTIPLDMVILAFTPLATATTASTIGFACLLSSLDIIFLRGISHFSAMWSSESQLHQGPSKLLYLLGMFQVLGTFREWMELFAKRVIFFTLPRVLLLSTAAS